jgi:hypothetical protein
MQPFPAPDTTPIEWLIMRTNLTNMSNQYTARSLNAPNSMGAILDLRQLSSVICAISCLGNALSRRKGA